MYTMIEAAGLLGVIYMTVAANYLGVMLTPELQAALSNSTIVRHCVVLFGALFWVASYVRPEDDFSQTMLKVTFVYALFVMSTHVAPVVLAPVLVLLVLDQVARVYVFRNQDSNPRLAVMRQRLQYTIVTLVTCGFLYNVVGGLVA